MIIAIQKCLNKTKKIFKYNHGENITTMKIPFIVNADMECLLERIGTCRNNPNKSTTTKITKHLASGFPLFTHCSVDAKKKKK